MNIQYQQKPQNFQKLKSVATFVITNFYVELSSDDLKGLKEYKRVQ